MTGSSSTSTDPAGGGTDSAGVADPDGAVSSGAGSAGVVVSVNVARTIVDGPPGGVESSGIDKRPVTGAVHVDDGGIVGDLVVNTAVHGGIHQALYAFQLADLLSWSTELDRQLSPGAAGENLTLDGVDCNLAVIGERWRIGGVVVRVTGPRIPCRTLPWFWGQEGRFVPRFAAAGRPGAYFAVERPGSMCAGAEVEVLHRPDHEVTVRDVFAWRMGRPELTPLISRAVDDLPPKLRDRLARAVATTTSGGDDGGQPAGSEP
ncbi:MOSC domain-containing protein [Solwaraspora sp. WMMD406]|uniref:MOSC domain-containing protein n=1 Tax=Solwaraspora sp. WMMD406 TaxID=3016095 RepID=UPI0024170E92|nr:MOSC domain-containing protein [Solwaraspora sp. WMMD406]MDG4765268.1 MOSC domain-containing protein [Solwaraspora sp. WMMD406]